MVQKDRVTPAVLAALRHNVNNIGADQKANYGAYRTSPAERFQFSRLARIIEVNYESNTVTVIWLDQMGTRDEVPIAHPYLGFRGHIMAMPEINSLVIVGFLHGIRPYIQCYLPFNYPLMVQATQFPETIEDINFQTEEIIKTQVESREDFNLHTQTADEIRKIKDLEILVRTSRTRMEEYSISKPLLEPGEIDIQSVNGAEIRVDMDLTLNDMNLDEIRLQAEDNSILVRSMHWIKNTEWGQTIEGQIRRPFGIREPRRKSSDTSDPFKSDGKRSALDAIVDPMMDRILYPIGKRGRLDVKDDDLKSGDYELIYQFKVLKELPFAEKLVTCNEYSANSVFANGEDTFIPLPDNETFKIKKAVITRTDQPSPSPTKLGEPDTSSGIVKFDIKQEEVEIKFIVDTNPFRPIENRFTTFRPQQQDAAFTLRAKDSLFNRVSELLGLKKEFFSQLYQDLIEAPSNAELEDSETRKKDEEILATLDDDGTIEENKKGELSSGQTPTDKLQTLRNKLRTRIAGQQLGFLLSDDIINQSFGQDFAGEAALKDAEGAGAKEHFPPIGPLFRTTVGTLVDGHDRMIKDPHSFEHISFQIRQQTGMFANIDRRGSANINLTNLLVNTVGMSFKSGFVHRNILETKISDKYNASENSGTVKPNRTIYLPEPIPTNTASNAGRVLNISPTDNANGSDPRNRKPSERNMKKLARSEIGQVPGTPKDLIPEPDAGGLGQPDSELDLDDSTSVGKAAPAGAPAASNTNPIGFLNELQIKIPKNAKIKPRNDVTDPSIVSYDAPRTKEIDLYSFQVDKVFYEKEMKGENADFDKMDRLAPFVEISMANVVDRDGTIIRSSMTQNPLALDLSVNVDSSHFATSSVDNKGSIDATHNNVYQRFNSGFVDMGLAYKVQQQTEQVEVRLNAQDDGLQPSDDNPNDVQDKESARLDQVTRQKYAKTQFKGLGQFTVKVNATSSDGIKSEVKTPKEIEKETSPKKVEQRPLRQPKENIPGENNDGIDVELNMGGVVDHNHTQNVKEARGFTNEKLHYRVKKYQGQSFTMIDIGRNGDWAVESNIANVNQTIINNVGYFQLGRVVEKNTPGPTGESPPPNSKSIIDGSNVQYKIKLKNGALIEMDENGNACLTVPGQVLIGAMKDITIASYKNVNINAAKNVNITAGKKIVLTAQEIDLNAPVIKGA